MTNVVQYDSNFNLSIGSSTSSSFNSSGSIIAASGFTGSLSGSVFGLGDTVSFSSSVSSRLTNIETKSASVDISISNINTITSSFAPRVSNLETKSASVDISITNINSFTASNANQSLNSKTGSYATTGSNTFIGTQIVSGSTYIQGDFVVFGSSSIQYISASSVSIGTNIVQLNTNQPAVRFGGLSVQDSGSAIGVTGSMFWDGCCNRWIYSNPSGVGYSGGVLMSGPRGSTLGNEPTLTCNYIAKSGGGDHLYDSCIIDDGTTVCVNANLKGSGTACFASSLQVTNMSIGIVPQSDKLFVYNASGTNTGLSIQQDGTGDILRVNGNSGVNKFAVTQSGISTFSCQICVPSLRVQSGFADLTLCGSNTTSPHLGGTFSITTNQDGNGRTIIGNATVGRAMYLEANGYVTFNCPTTVNSSLTTTLMTVATDCSGVIVDVAGRHGLMKYYNYGTGLIGACSATDGGISMWMGRFAGTITSPTALYQDLKILNTGIATFSCRIDTPGLTMGSIGHHQNYRNTSGCFAVFCASQGAVLYVTSMHNNGRSTAIINYANGVTGGASYSLLSQVSPYGPAALGFALCANGWLYAHHFYGGPMDFYAIQIGGTFTWAF